MLVLIFTFFFVKNLDFRCLIIYLLINEPKHVTRYKKIKTDQQVKAIQILQRKSRFITAQQMYKKKHLNIALAFFSTYIIHFS